MNENEIIEEWRPVVGYEGLYEVSNLGKVKSLIDNKGNYREKILKFGKRQNGYLYVNLWKEGKSKTCSVHRLVANEFIENPNNFPTVNHINEIKTDNRLGNLEWMDMKQQVNHGTCIQRRTEKTSKQVYQYDKNGTLVAIWQSTQECERNGYKHGSVAACCRGKRKTHRGFIWSYHPL